MYWHQGWEKAPTLVTQCKNSWIKLNPNYKVCALDQFSLLDYIAFPKGIDVRRKDLKVQKIAALGRLALLTKYGGVWADATVRCMRPLDDWLEKYYTVNFFAFQNPGVDRLMSNWFIAAEKESIIVQRLYKSFADFYIHNYFSNQGTAFGNKLLKYFNRYWSSDVKKTLNWHSWFARKILRVYPYSIFHYTFNKLILSDPECAALWRQIKPFLAEGPHRLQELAKTPQDIERAKQEIKYSDVPMYKLNWRLDPSSRYWATILQHLEEQP